MRFTWTRTVAPIVAATAVFANVAAAAERPNILLICVDDLKPALGCYGDALAKSPNIDRLAERGVRFDHAYCNQAVCAPSRNALFTGLRPESIGVYDLTTNFREGAADAVTLPQYFKSHGYRAEGLGKIYHIGHGNRDDGLSWTVPHWPGRGPNYAEWKNRGERGPAFESADVPDNVYRDGRIADEAVRRLQKAANTPEEPFFLAVGFVKPHLPFCAPQKYWDMYERKQFALPERRTPPEGAPPFAPTRWGELRSYAGIPKSGELPDDLQRTLIHGYYATVSYMDAQLGRVIEALDKTGLAKNTIIVLWGDHGWHLGDHGMWCKHTNYEQAARIPLIVVTPDGAQAGAKTDALAESVDIYPTLCKLAGLSVPAGLDGSSFEAVLENPSASTKEAIFHVYPRRNMIGRAVRTARHRLVEWKRPGAHASTAVLELYDYEADPMETKNLAEDQPEVVAALRAILANQPEAKPPLKMDAERRRALQVDAPRS